MSEGKSKEDLAFELLKSLFRYKKLAEEEKKEVNDELDELKSDFENLTVSIDKLRERNRLYNINFKNIANFLTTIQNNNEIEIKLLKNKLNFLSDLVQKAIIKKT